MISAGRSYFMSRIMYEMIIIVHNAVFIPICIAPHSIRNYKSKNKIRKTNARIRILVLLPTQRVEQSSPIKKGEHIIKNSVCYSNARSV